MTTNCPDCTSKAFKRNGFTRHGKQNHRCLDCGRQFSIEPPFEFVLDLSSKIPGGHHPVNMPIQATEVLQHVGASAHANG